MRAPLSATAPQRFGRRAERAKILAAVANLTEDERQRLMREFYDELIASHPRMAAYFSQLDLARQVRKLSATLQVLVAFADDRRALGAEVIRLGLAHSRRGIGEAEYKSFATTLAHVLARRQAEVRYERARALWLVELKAVMETMALVDTG